MIRVKKYNLIGQRFGSLVVIAEAEPYVSKAGNRFPRWLCQCDCGNTTYGLTGNLIRGKHKSCKNCRTRVSHESLRKHGGRHDRLYGVWQNMINRCYNENVKCYKNYGGRGVTVCDEWRHDYGAFRDWAIATGYDSEAQYGKCSIDRIDVDGNYEPSNCRWVDFKVQANNRRKKKAVADNA